MNRALLIMLIILVFIIIFTVILNIVTNYNIDNKGIYNDSGEIIDIAIIEDNPSGNNETKKGYLQKIEDINLRDVDGNKINYVFTYKYEDFKARYHKDTWKIYDSYKITNNDDLRIICEALITEHPIPGKEKDTFRTVDDLVYEWLQHNLAYRVLSDDNSWKKHAKDVDLDPNDQGKNLKEMYESRTKKKLDFDDF